MTRIASCQRRAAFGPVLTTDGIPEALMMQIERPWEDAGPARDAERDDPSDAVMPAAIAPALVGRDDALADVTRALRSGRSLVLIEGEPGIGKSRLLHEACKAVADHAVLLAPCPPVREPFPLGPIVDGVRRLRPTLSGLVLTPLAGALRPLFPEWAGELPPALEALEDPKETRHRLLRAMTELLDRLGVATLVVEDAHWADAATLEWLLTLCASSDLRMSLVLTYRPHDIPAGSLLRRLTSRRPVGMALTRIELQPLDVKQTKELVRSILGTDEVSEKFAVLLHQRTDGIPLALEETVRSMRERGDIVHRDGEWIRRTLDELRVSPTLRDSVLERVDRLPEEARRVLEAAAVLGEPVDVALLTAVAGADGEAAQRGISRSLAAGLLRDVGRGRLAFRHVLDAAAVADAIPAPERWQMHQRAAENLQNLDPRPVTRLMRHLREANDIDGWSACTEEAADLAWESGDDHTAVALLLEVLTQVEHPVEAQVRLVRNIGRFTAAGGASFSATAADVMRALRSVLANADLPAGDRGEIRLLLGRLLLQSGQFDVVYQEVEAAVPDLADRPTLAAKAMLSLAVPRGPWPASTHLAWLDRANELSSQVRAPVELLELSVDRALIQLMFGEETGWHAAREILHEDARTVDERRQIARALVNFGHLATSWGLYKQAEQFLAGAIEEIHTTGYERLSGIAHSTQARLDWYAGAWSGLADKAAAVSESPASLQEARIEASGILALLDLAEGRRGAAKQRLRDLFDETSRRGMVDAMVVPAAALGRSGLLDGAVDEPLDVTADLVATIARKGLWLWATDVLPVRIEALVTAGADTEVDALLGQFTVWLEGRSAPAPAAALLTCRAIVAEARSGGDAADLFADAALAWATLPRPYDELVALERRGRCLIATGRREEALQLLSDTERRLRELGAKRDADRVAQVLREHGTEVVRTWRRGPQGYGDQLSPRELEVAGLAARGMTNRQIADALYISHRTVGQHLAGAMRKLGVSSRTALAVTAARAGLLPPEEE
ncbi:helix-turn-helix transcriptional regulator [Streptomyces spiralis]|uniref:helix-turn-helix transcriptional regulator n=1 Tax=Streptomyces spiralis TaxID=66376 RepID=UPI0033C20679